MQVSQSKWFWFVLIWMCFKDEKMIRAADIAEAKIAGEETPSYDPHKKADRENEGWLTGDQTTIAETPVAPVGAQVGTK
mgnify:FL=1